MVIEKIATTTSSPTKKKTHRKKRQPFSKQFLGKTKFKIRKVKEERIFGSRIRNTIYVIILLFFAVIFINLQPNSNLQLETGIALAPKKSEFSYLFYDTSGNSYSLFGQSKEHGAPQSWEYLFEGVDLESIHNETVDDEPLSSSGMVITGDVLGTGEEEIPISPQPEQESGAVIVTGEEHLEEVKGEPTTNNGEKRTAKRLLFIYQDIFINWRPHIKFEEKGVHIIPDYKSCATPWGYSLQHGGSILAYQQDFATPDTCNIERRFCWDGKLSGTFGQQSCSVNTAYSYFQEQFVSYNTKEKSDFIQPSATPSYTAENLANGTTKRGIDEVVDTPNPGGTSWTSSVPGTVTNSTSTDQTERYYPSCITPRGETVQHGQFVKAYKHKNGFNDAPCQVQLRTCVVGQLEGSYQQLSCTHWDTSYIDWLNNSPTRETYSQAKKQWIQEIRNSETHYQLEYGNSLTSESLDKILNILDM